MLNPNEISEVEEAILSFLQKQENHLADTGTLIRFLEELKVDPSQGRRAFWRLTAQGRAEFTSDWRLAAVPDVELVH